MRALSIADMSALTHETIEEDVAEAEDSDSEARIDWPMPTLLRPAGACTGAGPETAPSLAAAVLAGLRWLPRARWGGVGASLLRSLPNSWPCQTVRVADRPG